MLLVSCIVLVFLLSWLDSSLASLISGLLILFITCVFANIGDEESRETRIRCGQIVFFVYVLMAFIFSQSFEEGAYYIVSDPMRYIDFYGGRTYFYFDEEYLIDCYNGLADSNLLFNAYLLEYCVIGNVFLGGTTVFYITLAQTLFGILSVIVLFRILDIFYEPEESLRHSLIFGFCSLFLFYSCVVIRDIVIAFFFLLAIEIILKPYNPRKLIWLVIMMLIVWGIRLYSGFFYCIFIAIYWYKKARDSDYRFLSYAFFAVIAIGTLYWVFQSGAIDQTLDEVQLRNDETEEAEISKQGLISRLYALPPGIKQISIMVYSQMAPFPVFTIFKRDLSTISHCIMTFDTLVNEVFWFFIFFIFASSLIIKKSYQYFTDIDKLLLLSAFIYIIVNTAHPDIRRMMPVYPIIYYLYLKVKDLIDYDLSEWIISTRACLLGIYVCLSVVYLFVK